MTQSESEDERITKHRKRSRTHKYVESSSDDDGSSSDEGKTKDERTKKHKRAPSQLSEKSRDKEKQRRRERHRRHKEKRHKQKTEKSSKDSAGPVQLSKFLGRERDDGVRRSAISGKKIQLKVEKSREDKLAETSRNELLKFLNASYD